MTKAPQSPVCSLCLFKVEVDREGEAQLETAVDLVMIINEIFKGKVSLFHSNQKIPTKTRLLQISLTEQELTIVRACVPCCEKLTTFYDYYTSVLSNQNKLIRTGLKQIKVGGGVTLVKTPPLSFFETKLIKQEPPLEISLKVETVAVDEAPDSFLETTCIEECDDNEAYDDIIEEDLTEEEELQTLEKTSSTQDFIKHNLVYTCPECRRKKLKFDSYNALQEHADIKHGHDFQLTCCSQVFIRQHDFARHLIKEHKLNNQNVIVDEHYLTVKDRKNLDEERDELISKFFILKCFKCSENVVYRTLSALQSHVKEVHKRFLNIKCCHRKFNYRSDLADHIRNKHTVPDQPKPYETAGEYRCQVCSKQFREFRLLESHRFLVHESFCEHCNIDLNTLVSKTKKLAKSDVISHQQQHLLSPDISKPAPYVCDHCSKKLPDREKLKYHMERWHKDSNIVSVVCEHCGEGFKSTTLYSMHLATKHPPGGLKVPCKICGVMIKNNERAMQMHFNNIHNPTPTQCPVCGIISRSKKTAKCHFSRNHTEKKHACETCGKKFASKDRLKEHEATHLGINLYYCELCEARYKNKSNFAMHKRKNHPEEYAKEKAEKEARKYRAE